jgi:hypothetical protein
MHLLNLPLHIPQPTLVLPSLLLLRFLRPYSLSMLLLDRNMQFRQRVDGKKDDDGSGVTESADLGGGEGVDPGGEVNPEGGVVEEGVVGSEAKEFREELGEGGAELLVRLRFTDERVGVVRFLYVGHRHGRIVQPDLRPEERTPSSTHLLELVDNILQVLHNTVLVLRLMLVDSSVTSAALQKRGS